MTKLQARVEWDEIVNVCGMCSGNGCRDCGGGGEVFDGYRLASVTCACGWECTGEEWNARTDPLCPDCRENLESEVEMTRPPCDEPDVDPYDLEDC